MKFKKVLYSKEVFSNRYTVVVPGVVVIAIAVTEKREHEAACFLVVNTLSNFNKLRYLSNPHNHANCVSFWNNSTHPAAIATAAFSTATLAPGPDSRTARAQHL